MKTLAQFAAPQDRVQLPYLLTLPTDFDAAAERLPLILFLHGAGERGADGSRLRVHGIPACFGADEDHLSLRVITLSPQCPEGETWNALCRPVFALLRETIKKYNADPDRISITGISMGGFGTWEMLCCYPDFFAAAAPICGGGASWRICTSTPVRAFHGDADTVVPLAYSTLMVDAVNTNGGNAELTVYHGCGHDAWTQTYAQTDVIRWLAEARRA